MRQNRTRIVRFETIHIGSVTVYFLSDAVAGAVHKIFSVACHRNDLAGNSIHLPSFDRTAARQLLADKCNGLIARLPHMLENALICTGNTWAQITDPGDVVIDAAGALQFSPNIKEKQVALANRRRHRSSRLIVRIPAMGSDGHDGSLVRGDGMVAEFFENPLLQLIFRQLGLGTNLRGGVRESLLHDAIDALSSFLMRLKLLRARASLDPLHQIRRTDHRATLGADHLHGSGINQRNVRYGIPRRILHGHLARPPDQTRKILVELVEAGVDKFLSRQTIERPGLDAVHQLPWGATARNEVEPATSGHAAAIQPQYTRSNRVAMMEIVEKPAVQAGGSQLFLYRIDWRHYFSIAGAAFAYSTGTRKVTYGDELFALWNMPWRRFDRPLRLQLQLASGRPAHPRRF